MSEPFQPADQIQPPPPPPVEETPPPDAGQERGPTTAHPDTGWRSVPTTSV